MAEHNEDGYSLVTIHWQDVQNIWNQMQQDHKFPKKIKLNEDDFEDIARDLSYDYEHDWDFDTAIEEQIYKFIEDKFGLSYMELISF